MPNGQVIQPVTNAFNAPFVDPTTEAAKANHGKPEEAPTPTAPNAFNAPAVDPTLEAAKANHGKKIPKADVPAPASTAASLPGVPRVGVVAHNAFGAPARPATEPTATPAPATVIGTVAHNAFAAPAVPTKVEGKPAKGTVPAKGADKAEATSGNADTRAKPDTPATVDASVPDSGSATPTAPGASEPANSAATGNPSPSPEAPATKGKPKQLLVQLILNGQDLGLQFVLKEGDRLLVDNNAFKDNNASGSGNSTTGLETYHSRQFADPAQRYPGSTVKLSDSEDKLTITLPGTAFGKQKILINQLAPVVPLTSVPSAYLNYSLGESSQRVGSAYFDGGLSVGTWLLHSSESWSLATGWLRGMTALDKDDPKHLRRFTLGDQTVYSTDGLGGGTTMAGIGMVRAFDLDPYLITLPQPTLSGVLQAPGTIEVYRNGQLVAQRQVGAGPFSLEQLGVGIGENNVKVVIRDPFGGTREISQSFYAVNNNLAKGLSEYAYQVGINSPIPGQQYETDHPVLLARQRWGLTDSFTAGYRIEAEKGLENVGVSTDFRLPFGGLHLAGGASKTQDGTTGYGGTFNYSVSGQKWSMAVGATKLSDGYRRLGDSTIQTLLAQLRSTGALSPTLNPIYDPTSPFYQGTDGTGSSLQYLINPLSPAVSLQQAVLSARLTQQAYGTVSYSPIQPLLFQASASRSSYADGRTDKVLSLGANLSLHGVSFYFGLDKSRLMNKQDRTVNLNVTIPFGINTVTASRTQGSAGVVNALDFQRSLPADTGVGYAVHVQNGSSGLSENGNFSAQNNLARLNLQVYNSALARTANAQLAGSVVFIDKEFHFGRPLSSGYALVRVGDGLKGVPVIRENQEVGKTGHAGSFLVSDLLPYQNNQLGFEQKAIPPAYTMQKTEAVVNVPRSGGTVVDFHVRPLKAIRGILEIDGKPLSGGAVTHVQGTLASNHKKEDRELTPPSPMGSKGNFYLEDVPPGTWELTAQFEGRLAKCPITVPVQQAPVYRINDIHCAWTGVASDGSAPPMVPADTVAPAKGQGAHDPAGKDPARLDQVAPASASSTAKPEVAPTVRDTLESPQASPTPTTAPTSAAAPTGVKPVPVSASPQASSATPSAVPPAPAAATSMGQPTPAAATSVGPSSPASPGLPPKK